MSQERDWRYSLLAAGSGLVTGKFTLENRPTENRQGNILFKDPSYELSLDAVGKLPPIAEKYSATTGQLALAWLIAQPGVTSPIAGARTPTQISDSAKAAAPDIDATNLEAISAIGAVVTASQPTGQTNPWK